MNNPTPCLSFIGIVDFSQEAKWIYMTDSVTDLLGYEPKELVGRPSLELVHPDEFGRVKKLHYDTIQQDKAAVLVYLRMRHKDPYRGYVLCGVSRTVVHNVLVGSVSFASPGAKALHNASTAQEITVITPSAANFEFRRWHDPSPMPPSPIPESMMSIPAHFGATSPISPTLSVISVPASSSSSSSSWSSGGSTTGRRTPTTIEGGKNKRARTTDVVNRTSSSGGSRSRSRSPPRGRIERYIEVDSEDYNYEDYVNGTRQQRTSFARGGSDGSSTSGKRRPSSGSVSSLELIPSPSSPLSSSSRGITDMHDPNVPFEFAHLPSKSFRTALILDRFSTRSTVLFCSNELLIPSLPTLHLPTSPTSPTSTSSNGKSSSHPTTKTKAQRTLGVHSGTHSAINKSFFEYVDPSDEQIVKEWISCVKGWGVNEKGQPSDGGFGFGRFRLVPRGRGAAGGAGVEQQRNVGDILGPPPLPNLNGSGAGREFSRRPANGALNTANVNHINTNLNVNGTGAAGGAGVHRTGRQGRATRQHHYQTQNAHYGASLAVHHPHRPHHHHHHSSRSYAGGLSIGGDKDKERERERDGDMEAEKEKEKTISSPTRTRLDMSISALVPDHVERGMDRERELEREREMELELEREREMEMEWEREQQEREQQEREQREREREQQEREERERREREHEQRMNETFIVDAIFSAHSDGLMVILRRA